MAKAWQTLVETAPTRSYQRLATHKDRLLARYVPKSAFDGGDPPAYLYASGNRNRCNPRGVACVYFGEGPETARAEFDSYFRDPQPELGFYARTRLKAIIDLEDPGTRRHFGIKPSDFSCSAYPRSGGLTALQQLGLAVSRQKRISAIRFPSNAMRNQGKAGTNLVVFQDLLTGSDRLEVLEGTKIRERWPK